MARISYADPARTKAESRDLVERIKAERGDVLHLYAMLLNSPPFAEGWLKLLTAVRQEGILPGTLREMMIIRVAHLNDAPYEAEQHRPIAEAEGLSEAQVDAIADWKHCPLFDIRQRAALAYCDELTKSVRATEPVFAALRDSFDDREITELTITIAAYNMVSRVLEALQIHSTDTKEVW
jgi:AhpD family alkylhydroperoxidase